MNGMVGQKLSIVTAKAQTTRHRILSLISEPDYQMIFLDTPGIMNVICLHSVLPSRLLSRTCFLIWIDAIRSQFVRSKFTCSFQHRFPCASFCGCNSREEGAFNLVGSANLI